MYNYAVKSDLNNAAGVDSSDFDKKADLASLKSDVYKSDFDKLEKVTNDLDRLKSKVDKLDVDQFSRILIDLSKLCNVVKNNFVKRTDYN